MTPLVPDSSALPLVTIVALCYNHAQFLRPALDSILAQTYPKLEVILVDDGSPIPVAPVADAQGRITIVRQDNAGPALARNFMSGRISISKSALGR